MCLPIRALLPSPTALHKDPCLSSSQPIKLYPPWAYPSRSQLSRLRVGGEMERLTIAFILANMKPSNAHLFQLNTPVCLRTYLKNSTWVISGEGFGPLLRPRPAGPQPRMLCQLEREVPVLVCSRPKDLNTCPPVHYSSRSQWVCSGAVSRGINLWISRVGKHTLAVECNHFLKSTFWYTLAPSSPVFLLHLPLNPVMARD